MDAGSCLMYRWQNIGVQIFLLLFIISVHHPNTSVSNDCDCVSADFLDLYTFTENNKNKRYKNNYKSSDEVDVHMNRKK